MSSNKKYLGIDIGSSGIKVVELKKGAKGPELSSYGFSDSTNLKLTSERDVELASLILKKIIKESGIDSKTAIAALPAYAVFSSVLNLSNVNKKEIESAVHWEAKKVIPLPLEEMILDWQIVEEGSDADNIKVLLTGAPKNLVKQYIDVFKKTNLNLFSLETETFSLIRSILGNDKSTVLILELGHNTTDVTIARNGIPVLSRSIDLGGLAITRAISRNLGIAEERAEQFKYDLGVGADSGKKDSIPSAILETIAPIINEVKYTIDLFENKENQKVESIFMSGGTALLFGLAEHLEGILNLKVFIGDPWAHIYYPEELKPTLDELGPKLSVSIGLAMRGFH